MRTKAPTSLESYGKVHAATAVLPRLDFLNESEVVEDARIVTAQAYRGGFSLFEVRLDAGMLFGGNLVDLARLKAFTVYETTPPKRVVVYLPERASPNVLPMPAVALPDSASQTLAQAIIGDIKRLSGLTNELVAPLAGVSRRSLQAWIAGEPISQAKQQRLLDLRDAVHTLHAHAGSLAATHRLLMDQAHGRVRVYDLLAAGRFNTAVDMVTGRHRILPQLSEKRESESLAAQMSRLEDRVKIEEAPSTGRFSGRLRR